MDFNELLKTLSFEYHAEMAATCQPDPPWGNLLDGGKVNEFPCFYDWLTKSRGISRHKLSAHGIGRDILALA